MKKSYTLLIATLFSLFLFSCQKEISLERDSNTGNNIISDIAGTWRFVNFRATTLVINEISDATDVVKTVTTSDYTTGDNTGTVVFTDQNMSYDNLSYSIQTIAYAKMYENGVLIDTFSMPMQASIPLTKGSAPFTRIGSDSLYFQGGTFMMNGVSQNANARGAKLKREQDKLYLTQWVDETSATTIQGQTIRSSQKAEVVVTFQKQ